jgi:hypothetical protein
MKTYGSECTASDHLPYLDAVSSMPHSRIFPKYSVNLAFALVVVQAVRRWFLTAEPRVQSLVDEVALE